MRSLKLSRDSVSAGDDIFDHTTIIEISSNWNLRRIIQEVADFNFLPKISGGKATWSIAFDRPLGIIAQEWFEPKLFVLEEYPRFGTPRAVGLTSLHFNYHAQLDPELVYEVLRRFKMGIKTEY